MLYLTSSKLFIIKVFIENGIIKWDHYDHSCLKKEVDDQREYYL